MDLSISPLERDVDETIARRQLASTLHHSGGEVNAESRSIDGYTSGRTSGFPVAAADVEDLIVRANLGDGE